MCRVLLVLTIISAALYQTQAQVPMTMGNANNADFAVGQTSYNGDYYGRAYSDADFSKYQRWITIAFPAGFITPNTPLFMLSLRIMNSIINESGISYGFSFNNHMWVDSINQTSLTYFYGSFILTIVFCLSRIDRFIRT